jgi:hypothetical protein
VLPDRSVLTFLASIHLYKDIQSIYEVGTHRKGSDTSNGSTIIRMRSVYLLVQGAEFKNKMAKKKKKKTPWI